MGEGRYQLVSCGFFLGVVDLKILVPGGVILRPVQSVRNDKPAPGHRRERIGNGLPWKAVEKYWGSVRNDITQ